MAAGAGTAGEIEGAEWRVRREAGPAARTAHLFYAGHALCGSAPSFAASVAAGEDRRCGHCSATWLADAIA